MYLHEIYILFHKNELDFSKKINKTLVLAKNKPSKFFKDLIMIIYLCECSGEQMTHLEHLKLKLN